MSRISSKDSLNFYFIFVLQRVYVQFNMFTHRSFRNTKRDSEESLLTFESLFPRRQLNVNFNCLGDVIMAELVLKHFLSNGHFCHRMKRYYE